MPCRCRRLRRWAMQPFCASGRSHSFVYGRQGALPDGREISRSAAFFGADGSRFLCYGAQREGSACDEINGGGNGTGHIKIPGRRGARRKGDHRERHGGAAVHKRRCPAELALHREDRVRLLKVGLAAAQPEPCICGNARQREDEAWNHISLAAVAGKQRGQRHGHTGQAHSRAPVSLCPGGK